jgi:hypothetical protein
MEEEPAGGARLDRQEGYFESFAFYRRVGVVAAFAFGACALLAMRAWSLELLHSRD